MFSYLSPEQGVRKDHPLRVVRAMTDEILERMLPLFDAMYAPGGGRQSLQGSCCGHSFCRCCIRFARSGC